jgi:Flp pilus assembly protein TadG
MTGRRMPASPNMMKTTVGRWLLRKGMRRGTRRFASDEDGAITIFALFLFVAILTAAGLGIDVMRHEMARTHLQATLDSAVLAGAGAPVDATADDVKFIVEDYFDAADLGEYLDAIDPVEDIVATLNSKSVTASAQLEMDTFLMRLSGVDTLSTAGAATAAIASPRMEIVLALDVSGSMEGERLTKMKTAAKQFVSDVLSASDQGTTTISIVPYSWSVTPSDELFEALSVDKRHTYSTCIDFIDADFDSTAIDPTRHYGQTIYTSKSGSFGSIGVGDPTISNTAYNRSCYTDEYFRILPYSNSVTALHNKIDSLKAAGSTSTDLGVKWAAGLLDPAFAPVVTALQQPRTKTDSSGNVVTYSPVDPTIQDTPALYSTGQVLKVAIVMGDGANDWSYGLADPNGLMNPDIVENHTQPDYRGPDSHLYRVEYSDDVFKYRYYVFNPNIIRTTEWNCNSGYWVCVYESVDITNYYLYSTYWNDYTDIMNGGYLSPSQFQNLPNTLPNFESKTRLSWEEAWGLMTPDFYSRITHDYAPDNMFDRYGTGSIAPETKDERMADICSATKARGIVLYTIAFEMGSFSSAADRLESCASSSAHHFNATTLNIAQAFGSIAANVQKLRLTQ